MGTLISIAWLLIIILVIVTIIRDDGSTGHEVLWIILVALLPLIGLIGYFILGNATKQLGT